MLLTSPRLASPSHEIHQHLAKTYSWPVEYRNTTSYCYFLQYYAASWQRNPSGEWKQVIFWEHTAFLYLVSFLVKPTCWSHCIAVCNLNFHFQSFCAQLTLAKKASTMAIYSQMHIIAPTKGKEITSRNINLSPCVLQFEIDCALWLIMYFSHNHYESTK